MFYDKKIKYLNYIVDGERVRGCGFVKVELRDQVLNLEVMVNGLPATLHCVSNLWLCAANDNYSLGEIYLENGQGCFKLSNCNFKEICPVGVTYEDWSGIAIYMSGSQEISALWGNPCNCMLERVEVSKELVGNVGVASEPVNPNEMRAPEQGQSQHGYKAKRENVVRPKEAEQQERMALQKGPAQGENVARPKETEQQEGMPQQKETAQQEDNVQQVCLAEDKWEQLWGIYPHIKPFRDKREYLSIRPADFVLLSADSYRAVNNSFLLHGFHNYQHLILARNVKKGQVSYFVGTPGNFFLREKQVAIMFGFTGFECAKDPAGEGDFGYYLMEVQI